MDDKASWDALDKFEITGCQYETFVGLKNNEVGWRLRELDRMYAQPNVEYGWLVEVKLFMTRRPRAESPPVEGEIDLDKAVKQFKPQPYIQLAKAFRNAGYEAAARKILVRLERNKTRYSDIGRITQFWRYLLDIFLRYGYWPFKPVLFVLAWATVSAVMFQTFYDDKVLVQSKDNRVSPTATEAAISFNAMVYAVDTLVPIVDLGQKKNWTIRKVDLDANTPTPRPHWWQEAKRVWSAAPNSGIGFLLIFNTFFGWLMTTLFAAGVSGLLRKDG